MANDRPRRLDVLRDDYAYLSQNLRVSKAFLGYLFQERVISSDEHEELSGRKHTTAEKIELLVMDYLLRSPDDDLDKIIKALRVSEQKHLAKRLESLDKKTNGGGGGGGGDDSEPAGGTEALRVSGRLTSSDKKTKGGADKSDGRKRSAKTPRVSKKEPPAKRVKSSDKKTKDKPDGTKRSAKALQVSEKEPRGGEGEGEGEGGDEPDGGERPADAVPAKQATEKFLYNLAKHSQNDWKDIARELGFKQAEMGAIEKKHFSDVKEQCIEMLCRWRNRTDSKGTLAVLKTAYKEAQQITQFETAVEEKIF